MEALRKLAKHIPTMFIGVGMWIFVREVTTLIQSKITIPMFIVGIAFIIGGLYISKDYN